jgi:hypothetical protein
MKVRQEVVLGNDLVWLQDEVALVQTVAVVTKVIKQCVDVLDIHFEALKERGFCGV